MWSSVAAKDDTLITTDLISHFAIRLVKPFCHHFFTEILNPEGARGSSSVTRFLKKELGLRVTSKTDETEVPDVRCMVNHIKLQRQYKNEFRRQASARTTVVQ